MPEALVQTGNLDPRAAQKSFCISLMSGMFCSVLMRTHMRRDEPNNLTRRLENLPTSSVKHITDTQNLTHTIKDSCVYTQTHASLAHNTTQHLRANVGWPTQS